MKNELKIIVINPPSEEHIEDLCNQIKDFIQTNYYS